MPADKEKHSDQPEPIGGKGGGKPDNARGIRKESSKLDAALVMAKELVD